MPLAGSRDSVPCGVWGNAPTVPRAFNFKEAASKGAGSEASLPVTLRVLRRAPKLFFRPTMLCRARWARPNCWSCDHRRSFPNAGISRLRTRQGGNRNRRSLRSPLDPFARHLPCFLFRIISIFCVCGRRNQSSIERKSFYAALFFPAVYPSENPASGGA